MSLSIIRTNILIIVRRIGWLVYIGSSMLNSILLKNRFAASIPLLQIIQTTSFGQSLRSIVILAKPLQKSSTSLQEKKSCFEA